MRILAFDTSMRSVSVAVATGSGVVARLERETPPAERLLPMLREVMAEAGVGFADLERIAVTLGPGGFTGIRVGLAMASGLRRATGHPVVALGSLTVMAHAARVELGSVVAGRPVVVAVPAGRGGHYVQTFSADGMAEGAIELVESAPAIELPGDAVLVGAGATALAAQASGRWMTALPELQPDAATLATLAPHLTPVDALRPMYIRPADAIPVPGAAPI